MSEVPERTVDERYRLIREIAAGGMGVVFEAEHVALQKRVALKLLRSEIADVPGIAARFAREARATSLLDSPHVVRVTDFGRTAAGELYLVMDLLEGASLGALLEGTPSLPVERALSITDQILLGLEAAHAQGLVHRDLKPDNVFLTPTEGGGALVRLLDFGIAAMRDEKTATKLTQTGAVMGTPAYMSPEQAMGRSDLDERTDVHAVGVMLYEMLAGQPAYAGENYNQVLHAILIGRTTPLASLRPGLSTGLYEVVARAMAGPIEARFPTARAMRSALSAEHVPSVVDAAVAATRFRMPARLETTDLHGTDPRSAARSEDASAPASSDPWAADAPRNPRPPAAHAPLHVMPLEEPALELDRPTPAAPAPIPVAPRRAGGGALLLGLALALGGAGYAAFLVLRAPGNAAIDLQHVPRGAHLTLDGAPIIGERLVLPISREVHLLRVEAPRKPLRTIRIVADTR